MELTPYLNIIFYMNKSKYHIILKVILQSVLLYLGVLNT